MSDLTTLNQVREAAGMGPFITVVYHCTSLSGEYRVVYDYGTVDNEPGAITERREKGWTIRREVLYQLGVDEHNPYGWGYYALIDEPADATSAQAEWRETRLGDHRSLIGE